MPNVSTDTIITEVDEIGVATITLNRPEQRNAINFEMDRAFHDAMWGFDADDDVRAIVVTGAGKAFCSGFDLSAGGEAFGRATHEAHDRQLGVDSDSVAERAAFWNMRTPVIAAINGAAIGVGLTLPLLFDIRIAAEDAKLAFIFPRRGILPEANSTWLLPRIVGLSWALELLLTGRTISGAEAAQMGLVSRAVPGDQVLEEALELARDIAVNCAPTPIAITKKLVYQGLGETDRLAAMQRETKLTWWIGEQPDAVEGVMSFFEKREPRWSGSKHVEIPEGLR